MKVAMGCTWPTKYIDHYWKKEMWMRMGIPQCKNLHLTSFNICNVQAHVIEQVNTIMIIHNPLTMKVALISNLHVPMPSPTKATPITCITPKGNLTISCKTCDVALEKDVATCTKKIL